MARRYQKPPVEEAFLELRFGQTTPWDPTVPGLLFSSLRDRFPKHEQRPAVQFPGPPIPAEVLARVPAEALAKMGLGERVMFKSEDGCSLVQVISPRIIAVNQLKPYNGWDALRANVQFVLSALQKVIGTSPCEIDRIGLRYINRISIPEPDVKSALETYFCFRPMVSPEFPGTIDNYIVGCDLLCRENRDHCRVQLTGQSNTPADQPIAILDIDYATRKSETMQEEEILQWADQAHAVIGKTFENSLTAKMKASFGEITESA